MAAPAHDDRFDLKMNKSDKELFNQAASLMGTSTASFVRAAAKEKAQALIEQETRLKLSQRDFLALNTAIDQAFAPNKALQESLETARKTVQRA